MTTAPDYGPAGQAATARQQRTVSVEGKSRGSAAPGVVVQAVRVLDLPARMHAAAQLSDRQYVAARRLTVLWWATRLGQRMSGGYGAGRGKVLTPDDGEDGPEDLYHDLMRAMPLGLQPYVQALLHDQHPGVKWLGTLQAGLGWVADYWKIERNPDPRDDEVVVEG